MAPARQHLPGVGPISSVWLWLMTALTELPRPRRLTEGRGHGGRAADMRHKHSSVELPIPSLEKHTAIELPVWHKHGDGAVDIGLKTGSRAVSTWHSAAIVQHFGCGHEHGSRAADIVTPDTNTALELLILFTNTDIFISAVDCRYRTRKRQKSCRSCPLGPSGTASLPCQDAKVAMSVIIRT